MESRAADESVPVGVDEGEDILQDVGGIADKGWGEGFEGVDDESFQRATVAIEKFRERGLVPMLVEGPSVARWSGFSYEFSMLRVTRVAKRPGIPLDRV